MHQDKYVAIKQEDKASMTYIKRHLRQILMSQVAFLAVSLILLILNSQFFIGVKKNYSLQWK